MRHALLAVAMLLTFAAFSTSRARAWDRASPSNEPWELVTFRLPYDYTEGLRAGTRTGGALVGVPYAEMAAGFELEVDHYDGRHAGGGHQEYPDVLGVALGLRFVARVSGVFQSDYASAAGVSAVTGPTGWAAPMRFSIGAGTMAQIIRATEFVLAAHFSIDFLASRSTWSQDVAFLLYPGLRMVWQPDPVRLQLGYDFLPFWIGQGRLEHRASAAAAIQLGSVGLGVRFTFTIGQERRPQGAFDDHTFTGALELVL